VVAQFAALVAKGEDESGEGKPSAKSKSSKAHSAADAAGPSPRPSPEPFAARRQDFGGEGALITNVAIFEHVYAVQHDPECRENMRCFNRLRYNPPASLRS
jgi:hypothetical protein